MVVMEAMAPRARLQDQALPGAQVGPAVQEAVVAVVAELV
jgi:hypothetical protein